MAEKYDVLDPGDFLALLLNPHLAIEKEKGRDPNHFLMLSDEERVLSWSTVNRVADEVISSFMRRHDYQLNEKDTNRIRKAAKFLWILRVQDYYHLVPDTKLAGKALKAKQ